MSEIAGDMAIGLCCSWCGVYFEKAHEYPVVCKDCAEGKRDEKLLKGWNVQNAMFEEL